MEDRTGKKLQKLLPWQLQKEPLRQREPRLQKGPVAAALPTVQWPAPRRFFFYSLLYGSLSKQTVLLLIMEEVTLLIYLPTQMQDVIEQN